MPGPIQVNITVTRTAATKTFQIAVSPDVIDLANSANAAVPIEWNITGSTPGWKFATQSKGIEIKNQNVADPPFQDNGRTSDSQYKWTRKQGKADGRQYPYSITVTDDNLTYVLDPIIINQ